jgi:uncharacterized protein YecT (DUF1311 family)
MKYGVVALVLLLVGCSASSTQLPLTRETPIPSSTPQIIEVTRLVRIEQTVIVTATAEPLLAQECFNNAVTQNDLNNCAVEERFSAQEQLENTISRIKLPSIEKQEFDKYQTEWADLIERNCIFYYDKWGSMRPMQQSMCIALRIKERIKELKRIYLTPDG